MTTIVTRTGKGAALTFAEMDANLTNLNTDKLETSTAASTYETSAHASSTYETISNAAATFATIATVATKQDSATAVQKDTSTGAAAIPNGTTGERPGSPSFGWTRANSTTGLMEWWNGSSWTNMGSGGATGGGSNAVFYENDITVTSDYTITTNKNAMTAGPITVNSGITVTVPSGSVWSIV